MTLKDLYSAESQLIEALPKMAEAATNVTLKQGFEEHLRQTEEQLKRIEEISENLEFNPKNHVCKGMEGLIKEGSELFAIEGDSDVVDAAIICAAQKVEHYEIAAYGCALELAKLMGHMREAELLQQTLDEEKLTDEKLNQVAIEEINPIALEKLEVDQTTS